MENEKTETKEGWHCIEVGTTVRNTATGVIVESYKEKNGNPTALTFIPGEHWDPVRDAFVAIGSVGERLQTVMETLVELRNSTKEAT